MLFRLLIICDGDTGMDSGEAPSTTSLPLRLSPEWNMVQRDWARGGAERWESGVWYYFKPKRGMMHQSLTPFDAHMAWCSGFRGRITHIIQRSGHHRKRRRPRSVRDCCEAIYTEIARRSTASEWVSEGATTRAVGLTALGLNNKRAQTILIPSHSKPPPKADVRHEPQFGR